MWNVEPGQDFTDLDVDLVTAKYDGDVLTDTLQVSVPVGNVLVGDSGSNIEHDDTTLTCDSQNRMHHPSRQLGVERTRIALTTHPECSIRPSNLRTSPDQRCPNS